jgi:hypothetical protein
MTFQKFRVQSSLFRSLGPTSLLIAPGLRTIQFLFCLRPTAKLSAERLGIIFWSFANRGDLLV